MEEENNFSNNPPDEQSGNPFDEFKKKFDKLKNKILKNRKRDIESINSSRKSYSDRIN